MLLKGIILCWRKRFVLQKIFDTAKKLWLRILTCKIKFETRENYIKNEEKSQQKKDRKIEQLEDKVGRLENLVNELIRQNKD